MLVIRRIYLYLVAAIGLAVMVGGIVFLGRTVLAGVVESGFADTALRRELIVAISLTAAGLVFWGSHWWLISRLTAGSLSERGDALRRLYLYLVLTAMTLLTGLGAGGLIDGVIRRLGSGPHPAIEITDPLPMLLVGALGWLFHWRLSAADRRDIGELNESAGLRQLYVYGVSFIALAVLLAGVVGLLRLASDRIIGTVSVTPHQRSGRDRRRFSHRLGHLALPLAMVDNGINRHRRSAVLAAPSLLVSWRWPWH